MRLMTAMYTMRRGGAYNRFIMMIEAFLEKDCVVHCLSLSPIKIQNPCFRNHVLFYPFKNKESLLAKLIVIFFFPFYSLFIAWRNKIDLIIAFSSIYGFLFIFSKLVLKRRMVTFIRGDYSFSLRIKNFSNPLFIMNKIIEYYGLQFSDKIITNNSKTQNKILKSLKKRKNLDIQVLYNNIPQISVSEKRDVLLTKEKYGVPGDAKILLTVGVLNRGKNIETLIQCLPQIRVENFYLLIVGDGWTEPDLRYRNLLQELVKKLKVEKKVIFTGWLNQEELLKIYQASDLFVITSLNEGMPNALLEALGLGLVCIGSRVPGIQDVLKYDELLIDPIDEEKLAQKVQDIFLEPQYFQKVKKLCEERRKEFIFDWKKRVFQIVTKEIS